MKRALISLVLWFSMLNPALADVDKISDYLDRYENGPKETRERVEFGIGEAADAFAWANTSRENDGYSLSYCPPPHISLDAQGYMGVFLSYLSDNEQFLDEPSNIRNFILLLALKRSFPCE